MKAINALFDQALQLESEGAYEAAEPIMLKAMELKEKAFGSDHPELATDYYNAGLLFFALDKYEQAEFYLMRSLKIEERLLGADHPELLTTLEHLAEVFFSEGHFEKSERYYRRFLELHAKIYQKQGVEVVRNLYKLAEICELQSKHTHAGDLRMRAQRLLDEELNCAWQKKAS